MSIVQLLTLALEALLGLFTAYAAYSLFSKTPASVQKGREALRYPRWYWVVAGCVATVGAIGLLGGLVLPVLGATAAFWMVAYFVVAFFTHLRRADFANLAMPLIFLAIFGGLAALRWAEAVPLRQLVGL